MDTLVENTPGGPRFYCHSCTMELDSVTQDFTCPHCQEGFIEELPAHESVQTPPPADDDMSMNDFINPHAIRLASEIFNSSLLSPLMLATPTDGRPNDGSTAEETGGSASLGSSANGTARGRRRGRRGLLSINNLDHILREILISVADGAHGGNTPMFFMGNPGDYAWGREGLDTIVTQLLNQMDNTGPPPLQKDKIAEIPKVSITREHTDIKLQCSVCWEDFKLDEIVRKLTCSHLYHESCIIPWLELHGTCPICRKSLNPDQPDEQSSLNAAANAVANTLRSLQDPYTVGGGQSSSSSDEGNSRDRPSTSSLRVNLTTPIFNHSPQQQPPIETRVFVNAQQQNDSQQPPFNDRNRRFNDRNNEGFRDDDNFD